MGYKAALRVWRGDSGAGGLAGYQVEVNEGEVVLDVLHRLMRRAPRRFGPRLSEQLWEEHEAMLERLKSAR